MKATVLRKKSDPAAWSKRSRRITALVKSGKSLADIGNDIGVSRERVRQLLVELNIRTGFFARARKRRRTLTPAEIKRITKLYQEGSSFLKIAEELDLYLPYLKSVMADRKLLGKFRCAECGRKYERTGSQMKNRYCRECAAERSRQRKAAYQEIHYWTDPEFRKRKLGTTRAWKESERGKKWLAEYNKKK